MAKEAASASRPLIVGESRRCDCRARPARDSALTAPRKFASNWCQSYSEPMGLACRPADQGPPGGLILAEVTDQPCRLTRLAHSTGWGALAPLTWSDPELLHTLDLRVTAVHGQPAPHTTWVFTWTTTPSALQTTPAALPELLQRIVRLGGTFACIGPAPRGSDSAWHASAWQPLLSCPAVLILPFQACGAGEAPDASSWWLVTSDAGLGPLSLRCPGTCCHPLPATDTPTTLPWLFWSRLELLLTQSALRRALALPLPQPTFPPLSFFFLGGGPALDLMSRATEVFS